MSVYANGLEVAGKAKKGKSTACFPDPCFSPPAPSAGWVVIPYANTAQAKDTANGSKTVFIEGKPVMLKDKSYFRTSTGNEGAAGPKGVSTGVKQGKAYFASWSMDIKVEGYNVCRHSDMMTHNHGSTGNTPPWIYTDKGFFEWKDCKDLEKELNKACSKSKCKTCTPKYNEDWKKSYCKFLSFKPMSLKELEANPQKLLEDLKAEIAEADVMQKLVDAAMDKAMELAVKQLIKLGAKFAGSKLVPIAGWIYSAATAVDDIAEASYYKTMYDGAVIEGNRIKNSILEVRSDIEAAINGLKNGDLNTAAEKIADWQRTAATISDCIRLRKCMFVPYKDTVKNSGGMSNPKGCCPGQTGHHLIPNSWVKSSGCRNYSYREAPTICVEGTDHKTGGSHESIHTITTEMAVPKENWGSYRKTSRSYTDARDDVLKAHAKVFPYSTCPRACLKEQLDNFYKDCGDLQVKQIGKSPLSQGTITDPSDDLPQ